jgi:2-dehydro-3-deoxy-D-arabinonate dehydratase
MTMKLYRTPQAVIAEHDGRHHVIDAPWDELIARDDLPDLLARSVASLPAMPGAAAQIAGALAPVGTRQEVWAAGVTYFRSREARMGEAKDAGGADCYRKVYEAARPELFFKATPRRVAGPGQAVRIRADSRWNVPEPELALVVSAGGRIVGYTIGNDMSSRDIEGENPLYLPQAKVYDQSCALGPCVLVSEHELPPTTAIRLEIARRGASVFAGSTTLAQLKRRPAELVEWLRRDSSFPDGCILLTGTGIVPPDEVTLQPGDAIEIAIDGIGTLANHVVAAAARAAG